MVAAELNGPRVELALAGAAVLGVTGLGALLAVCDPALAGRARPHPVLTGSLSDAASILATNLRVLSAPFALALLGLHRRTVGRAFGDLVLAGLTAINTLHVGLALGRYGAGLARYVPQLPLEWLALTIAITAWLRLRTGCLNRRTVWRPAAAVLALAAAAAAVETFATPHAHPGRVARTVEELMPGSPGPTGCVQPGVGCLQRDCAPGRPGRCKVAALPSPRWRSVPLGRPDAFLGFVNHPRIPQRRDPMNSISVIWNCSQIAGMARGLTSTSVAVSDRCRR